jgi:FkbM family methyltransferase
MRLDPRSETERAAIWTGEYDGELIAKCVSCLGVGEVALDIGANVGFWSVALAKKLSALGGRVYAFEPVRANYQRLTENLRLNALETVACAIRTALADEEGELEMSLDRRNGAETGNAVIVRGGVGAYHPVTDTAPVARLDRIAAEMRIDRCRFIKIDIEGAEVMALRGGREFLRRCQPIIFGEFNPFYLRQFGQSFLDAAELLLPMGYRMYRATRAGFVPVSEAAPKLCDVLFVPTNTPAAVLRSMGLSPS